MMRFLISVTLRQNDVSVMGLCCEPKHSDRRQVFPTFKYRQNVIFDQLLRKLSITRISALGAGISCAGFG